VITCNLSSGRSYPPVVKPEVVARTAVDVMSGVVAFAAGALVQTWVIFKIFYAPGMSPTQVLRDPRIWPVLLVQPAITLSLLTVVLRWRNETWRQLGLRQPQDWTKFLRQVTIGMLLMLVAGYLIRNLIIWPFHLQSHLGGLAAVKGNRSALAGLIGYILLAVGLNEELLFRAFLQTRVERFFGSWPGAAVIAAVITGIIFGLVHGLQGSANVVYAGILGMVLGIMYLRADRNLWVVVILHSLFDVQRAIQFFLWGGDL
jgi:membrane protease YdiL (CAAX protease family)